jgi:hypothetical protein
METLQKETLIAQNTLIAKFMEVTPYLIAPDKYSLSNMPFWSIDGDTPDKVLKDASLLLGYHENWNELIKVIRKILNISLKNDSMELYYNITDSIPEIEQAHEAVIEFINHYNTNNAIH